MELFQSIYNFPPSHVFLLNQYDLVHLRKLAEQLHPEESYKFATRWEVTNRIKNEIFTRFPHLDESSINLDDWDEKPYDPSKSKWNHFSLEELRVIARKMGMSNNRFSKSDLMEAIEGKIKE